MSRNEENMNAFVSAFINESESTETLNGMKCKKTTKSDLLDLFAVIGGLRNATDREIQTKFAKAWAENKTLAMKMIFYARDVREGLGERNVFRACLKWLVKNAPSSLIAIAGLIPEYGRWDDVYPLLDQSEDSELKMVTKAIIVNQFKKDMEDAIGGKPISLLAKWLKSTNTSSKESRRLGKLTANVLGLDVRSYRKALSKLRHHIDVTERKMSANKWEEIKYSNVPSIAMKNYNIAFKRHDEKRFSHYLEDVKNGKSKINASAVFPSDVYRYWERHSDDMEAVNLQWSNLPNYVEGENQALVMADVSGSMEGLPMATSVSLALYFAERNKGCFKDIFITFSERPEFVKINGNNIGEKFKNIEKSRWGMNTNLCLALQKILDISKENNVPPQDMPKSLIIISDMEFDVSVRGSFLIEQVKEDFRKSGYEVPKIIFWNVNSLKDTFHAQKNDENILLVSGHSPSVFKSILSGKQKDPYEYMLEILNRPRYEKINIW